WLAKMIESSPSDRSTPWRRQWLHVAYLCNLLNIKGFSIISKDAGSGNPAQGDSGHDRFIHGKATY
ncbi:MAG: hypothetical protein PHF75_06865, partial [Gallionella sp.]|nr:hypothetical protein [Gallionella sp.]